MTKENNPSQEWALSLPSKPSVSSTSSGFSFSYALALDTDPRVSGQAPVVPLAVFGTDLGVLETIVRFLHEKQRMGWTQIARAMRRSPKTVFASYHEAMRKTTRPSTAQRMTPAHAPALASLQASLVIPLSIFHDPRIGPLESLVVYLKGRGISCKDISALLARRPQTIFTSLRRVRLKERGAEAASPGAP